MAKMSVDSETCIGCGQCVAMFGDNFDFNEDGISTVKSQENVVPAMVDICPVGAIKIVEDSKEGNVAGGSTKVEQPKKDNKKSSSKITVDSETCIGCGQCISMYEDNFEFDNETGTSKVKSDENAVPAMEEICPVGAIKITEKKEKTTEENE